MPTEGKEQCGWADALYFVSVTVLCFLELWLSKARWDEPVIIYYLPNRGVGHGASSGNASGQYWRNMRAKAHWPSAVPAQCVSHSKLGSRVIVCKHPRSTCPLSRQAFCVFSYQKEQSGRVPLGVSQFVSTPILPQPTHPFTPGALFKALSAILYRMRDTSDSIPSTAPPWHLALAQLVISAKHIVKSIPSVSWVIFLLDLDSIRCQSHC